MRVYKDGDYIRYLECDPCGTPEKKAKSPTDAERIAAAVAVLRAVEPDAESEYKRYCSELSYAALRALAILEGRDQGEHSK